jgi:hypothetical protein
MKQSSALRAIVLASTIFLFCNSYIPHPLFLVASAAEPALFTSKPKLLRIHFARRGPSKKSNTGMQPHSERGRYPGDILRP